MNPLQEHPNLFANGKFKIKTYTGHEYNLGNGVTLAAFKNGVGRFTDVKLIARPIEDMTDEEISEMYNMEVTNEARKFYINGLKKAVLSDNPYSTVRLLNRNRFLYLLSIGVYPFDQSHFEDGTVIKSTNNE